MTNKLNISLAIFVLAFFIVPATSFGQARLGADANTNANVDVNATTTNINPGTSTGAEVDFDSDSNVDVDNRREMGANSNVKGALRTNSRGVTVTLPSQVNSEEDLNTFSANASMMNRSVANVNFSSNDDNGNRVSVAYNHRARFLGFIPVSLRSTTRVEARENGEIEVKSRLPWWSFMASGIKDIRSSIESRVSNNSEVKANASVDASASSRARVAEAIIAELNARAQVEAEDSTDE